jgi:hypothetical protein
MKSFAGLERAESVTAEELKATLNSYAESGAGIRGRVVIGIINRTPLTADDRAELLESARRGVVVHREMREPLEVIEYQVVVNCLNS